VDQLGDVGEALSAADPGQLYEALNLALTYNNADQMAGAETDPLRDLVVKPRVRGWTSTLTTRLDLDPDPPALIP